MSKNGGNGYLKDLGVLGQQFFNQAASEIRSNLEQVVGAAFSPQQGQEGHQQRSSQSSRSSSQATSPDQDEPLFQQDICRGISSASSMGGFCGSRPRATVSPESAGDQESSMYCDICHSKFNIWNRKKTCSECHFHYCGRCVNRDTPRGRARVSARTCTRCKILLSIPPVRADLMQLRVKDLQRYLVSKKVNTNSCVEKNDLVELVIRQNGGLGEASNPRPRAAEERKKSFPKAYVHGTHRDEWFRRFESGPETVDIDCDEDDDFVVVNARPDGQDYSPSARLHVESTPSAGSIESAEDAVATVAAEGAVATVAAEGAVATVAADGAVATVVAERAAVDPDIVEDIGSSESPAGESPTSPVERVEADEETVVEPINREPALLRGAGALPMSDDEAETRSENGQPSKEQKRQLGSSGLKAEPTPSPKVESASPRRFANQGLVYLSELEALSDVQELSVKQAKDILAMNRVNFKGVMERDELLQHVKRLWKQEHQAQKDKDNLPDCELCKICMDNPVDCVMLECGHMCTCTTCGKQLAECPICRQYVVRVVRTFKA